MSISNAKEMRAFFERLNVEQKRGGMSVMLSLEQQDAIVESFGVLEAPLDDIGEALEDLSDALQSERDALDSIKK